MMYRYRLRERTDRSVFDKFREIGDRVVTRAVTSRGIVKVFNRYSSMVATYAVQDGDGWTLVGGDRIVGYLVRVGGK